MITGYVLKHFKDGSRYAGYYVARPGSEHSYTRKLEHAQTFPTREAAQAAACVESEGPVALEDLIGR